MKRTITAIGLSLMSLMCNAQDKTKSEKGYDFCKEIVSGKQMVLFALQYTNQPERLSLLLHEADKCFILADNDLKSNKASFTAKIGAKEIEAWESYIKRMKETCEDITWLSKEHAVEKLMFFDALTDNKLITLMPKLIKP